MSQISSRTRSKANKEVLDSEIVVSTSIPNQSHTLPTDNTDNNTNVTTNVDDNKAASIWGGNVATNVDDNKVASIWGGNVATNVDDNKAASIWGGSLKTNN
jgi:hypothetical protein